MSAKHRMGLGRGGPLRVPPQVVGAMVELRVAEDLMGEDFQVFRNMAPVGSVDLVALGFEDGAYRIQATRGRRKKLTSKGSYNPHKESTEWDLLAVCYDNGIEYYTRNGERRILSHGHVRVPPPPEPKILNIEVLGRGAPTTLIPDTELQAKIEERFAELAQLLPVGSPHDLSAPGPSSPSRGVATVPTRIGTPR